MEKKYIVDNKKLMNQWNYEKNNALNLFPNEITCGSSKKVWWICPKGHSYEQIIKTKTKGIGCPICANKLVLKGYNDLATTNPELLKEWDYDKNDKLGIYPEKITKGAEKKVWWICPNCKNSWQQKVYHITSGIGCPKCHFNIKEKESIIK